MSDWGDFTLPMFGGVGGSGSGGSMSYGGVTTSNGGYTAGSTLNPQYAAQQNQLIKDQAQERQLQLENMKQSQGMRTDVYGMIQRLLGVNTTNGAPSVNAAPAPVGAGSAAPSMGTPQPSHPLGTANLKQLLGSGPMNQTYQPSAIGAPGLLGGGGAGTPPVGGVGAPGTVGVTNPANPFQAGIDKIEQSRTAAINRSSDEALNTSLARLQDRGLGGSTFALNAATGAERDKQSSLNDLSGQIGGLDIQGVQAGHKQQMDQIQILMQLLNGTGGGGQLF